MVRSAEQFPLWVSACGMVTIIGGIMRCNNRRIFKEEDFEYPQIGKTVLRNELWYGMGYIILGVIGMSYGLGFDHILVWIKNYSQWNAQNSTEVLHWISYINLMIDVIIILRVDVKYRRYLLQELTRNTDLQMTDHGGIRYKPNVLISPSVTVILPSSEPTENASIIQPVTIPNTSATASPKPPIEIKQESQVLSKQGKMAEKITKPLEIAIVGHSENEGV